MQVKKKPKKTAKAVPEKSRKKKQPSEDQIKKQPFLKRMLFGEEKPDLSELEAGSTTILDILSPTTVDTKSRDYIIVRICVSTIRRTPRGVHGKFIKCRVFCY